MTRLQEWCAATAVALLASGCMASGQGNHWKTVAPAERAPADVQIDGAAQKWWLGEGEAVQDVTVTGPRRARIEVRLLLPVGQRDPVPYAFEPCLDGEPLERRDVKSTPDPDATFAGAVVGDRDRSTIDVPAGPHRVGARVAGGSRFLWRVRKGRKSAGAQ